MSSSAFESVAVHVDREVRVIAVDGDDAFTWLNGQLTNDLKPLADGASVYGLFLTPKGRVLADALVTRSEGQHYVLVPTSTWEELSAQLEKYIIMEDVVLRPTDLAVVSATGPSADQLVCEGVRFRSVRGLASIEWLVDPSQLDGAERSLAEQARDRGGNRVDDAAWDAERVARGLPRFGRDFGGATYPQEAGLKRRAVSFQKGCYLGQEVVCMLESRGQLQRSLCALDVDGDVAPGVAIEDADGHVVGEVTSVASRSGRTSALGFVKRAAIEQSKPLRSGGHAIHEIRVVS